MIRNLPIMLPEKWRYSLIRVLYKGKGPQTDPNSYRGIALENTALKLLSNLLAKRLVAIVDPLIPEEQLGFRKGRSTIHAIRCLMTDIEEALRTPRNRLLVIFIDYAKAFDSIDRGILTSKLKSLIGENHYLGKMITALLSRNYIYIDDQLSRSEPIEQKVGVLQGDPLSPILFNIATMDVTKATYVEGVSLYMYADDMALVSTSEEKLQDSFDKLATWAKVNNLKLNLQKTVLMTFRRGGRLPARLKIYHENIELEKVNSFRYLGLTLQTNGKTFSMHIKERATAAIAAMNEITLLRQLSIRTAVQLFHMKISPILSYAIELIWNHLTQSDLALLEKVKALYLKKTLCLHKNTPSRLVYELTQEPFYIEELRLKVLLPNTPQYMTLLEELKAKKDDIWADFYITDAMTSSEWKAAGYELRHTMTRFAVHGFHHKLCSTKEYHHPTEDCKCELCGKTCSRYHAKTCENRKVSLTELCSDN